MYHEILSFSRKDREYLTEDILHDLLEKYLEIRAPDALAYGKAHFDREHPHVHVMISGNLVKSAKKLRIDRGRFQGIKREMERYQRREYPLLENSVVFRRSGGKKQSFKENAFPNEIWERGDVKRTIKEGERRRRTGEKGEKERVRETIINCLCEVSEKGFLDALQKKGFSLYRRGKSIGVQNTSTKRKYRLQTLGLYHDYLEMEKRWEKTKERSDILKMIELEKIREIWREMEYQEEIMAVLEGGYDQEEGRKKELGEIVRLKRKKSREMGGRTR